MVTKSERKHILEIVNNERIADRIVEYLNRNKEWIGYEVFKDEDGNLDEKKRIFRFLFKENWNRDRFLKYLPFFYYSEESCEEEEGNEDSVGFWFPERSFAGILETVEKEWEKDNLWTSPDEEMEKNNPDFGKLDEMLTEAGTKLFYFYELLVLKVGRSCKEVVEYIFDNCMFYDFDFQCEDWIHYLNLCERQGENDWFPKDLDYSLRILQESAGEKIDLIYPSREFSRAGRKIVFHFWHIPVGSDGRPIMRWLGIKTDEIEEVELGKDDDCFSLDNELLIIKTLPDTRIRNHNRDTGEWDVIYTGPRNIDVDFSLINRRRNELGLTQSDVSKAIDVSMRTYQKWESGDVKGISGFFLLRLMRYLDIKLDQITLDQGK